MSEILLLFMGAVYAVFTHNLLLGSGLGGSEMIRAAQRNSEILLTSVLISLFSAVTAALSVVITAFIAGRREIAREFFHYRLSLYSLPYIWHAMIFALVLLALYLAVNVAIALLPLKHKRILHKRMGMSVLNVLVVSVPLLLHREGNTSIGWAIGLGLGAGLAFYLVTTLINSGMHILQQNKAIPPMFTGVPATLVYTGLLALAFTGFAGGEPLF